MARIAGVDLPREKRIEIGLTYILSLIHIQMCIRDSCDNELGLTKESMEAGSYDAKQVMEETATAVDLLDSAAEGFGSKADITADGVSADHKDLSLSLIHI